MTSSPRWPRIVAEALRVMPSSSPMALSSLVAVSGADAAAIIRRAMELPRAARTPPAFLRPNQRDSWWRVLAALDQYGAALLAEPVGIGKTWIALAVAVQQRGPVVALVPAILKAQWELAAYRAGVNLRLWSHERASRGLLPDGEPALVIIDEAHRFRQPTTKRVQTVAPWLSGRRVLCCTATPIVNRLADLTHLLHFILPADVLALDGICQLPELKQLTIPPPALKRVVIRSDQPSVAATLPRQRPHLAIAPAEVLRTDTAVALINTIQASRISAVATLIRNVFLDAAASSDAALRAALVRYRALLLQARDAGGSTRAQLRHFAGPALDQLVFWSLLDMPGDSTTDLPLEDLPRVEAALDLLPRDGGTDASWLFGVQQLLTDARITICFTRHHATAHLLRNALGTDTAWINGQAAGIGPHRCPREAVLAAFGPDRERWRIRRQLPRHLVATDVAAEGLDLQAAGRVVHIDLPWTATRLDQREGRLLRSGQLHASVEIITRVPAPAIARSLAPLARVQRKELLARKWLDAVTEKEEGRDERSCPDVQSRSPERSEGGAPYLNTCAYHESRIPLAVVRSSGPDTDLVAIALQRGSRRGVLLLHRLGGAEWRSDQTEGEQLLIEASGVTSFNDVGPELEKSYLRLKSALTHAVACASLLERCWAPTLAWRIQHLARRAARARDAAILSRLDGMLRWVNASPTLGDLIRAESLAPLDDAALMQAEFPLRPPIPPLIARPVAMILFRSGGALLP